MFRHDDVWALKLKECTLKLPVVPFPTLIHFQIGRVDPARF